MDKRYEDIKTLIECEIDDVLKKDDITPADLDLLDKGVDILKDIDEMTSMEMPGYSGGRYGYMPYRGYLEYESDGSSYGRSRMSNYNNYAQNGSGNGRGNYNNGNGSSYGRYDDMRMMPNRDWM